MIRNLLTQVTTNGDIGDVYVQYTDENGTQEMKLSVLLIQLLRDMEYLKNAVNGLRDRDCVMKQLLERCRREINRLSVEIDDEKERSCIDKLLADLDKAIAEWVEPLSIDQHYGHGPQGEIEVHIHKETYKIDCTDEEHTDWWVIIGGDFVLSVKDKAHGNALARSLDGKILRFKDGGDENN